MRLRQFTVTEAATEILCDDLDLVCLNDDSFGVFWGHFLPQHRLRIDLAHPFENGIAHNNGPKVTK